MAITRLVVDGAWAANGLGNFPMDRLGRYVVVAGANGSGKSRLLSYIETTVWQKTPEQESLESQIAQTRFEADDLRVSGGDSAYLEQQLVRLTEELSSKQLVASSSGSHRIPIRFVPVPRVDGDPEQMSRSQIQGTARGFGNDGAPSWSQRTLPYIADVMHEAVVATSSYRSGSEEDAGRAINEYERLRASIDRFLDGGRLENRGGVAHLYGRVIPEANLSSGQQVILQLAVALHHYGSRLDGAILLMDEPENHLHPSILVDFFEALEVVGANLQIWVATHSVPLIAHLVSKDPSALWTMEGGVAKHAGRAPERALSALIGNEERIGVVSSFLSLPAQLASNNFAYQCLFEPKAVMTGGQDPQLDQIRAHIQRLRVEGRALKVLDFGAGKGRLVQAINADVDGPSALVEYVAFDEWTSDAEICRESISAVYSSADNRYFNNLAEMAAVWGERAFDVAVMTNVLHEIDPRMWVETLRARILAALCSAGGLLIVEDQRLPVGELAHKFGFVLLDVQGLKALFKYREGEDELMLHAVSSIDGRLTATYIGAELVERVDEDSVQSALKVAKELALQGVRAVREAGLRSYKDGMLHALHVQQYANASLALGGAA